MKNIYLFIAVFVSAQLFAQQDFSAEPKQSFRKHYNASVSELIFSGGMLGDVSIFNPDVLSNTPITINESSTIPRFSLFFHLGEQFHFNFANAFGIYTGIGVRNTGMINRIADTLKVKQRAYSIGVPLAIKLGNMGKKSYLALGGEAEFFFHFKQKTFLGTGRGEKVEKFGEWLSDRTNLIQPSVFLEYVGGKGSYIRLRYYLNEFLIAGKQTLRVNGVTYRWVPEQSMFVSLSIGTVIADKRK